VQCTRNAQYLWRTNVREGGGSMAIKRGERDIVKVDETESRDARAREHDSHPTADATAADDYD
jgi:hypothetical protein